MKKLVFNLIGLAIVTLLLVIFAVNANGGINSTNQVVTSVGDDPNEPPADDPESYWNAPSQGSIGHIIMAEEDDPNDPGPMPDDPESLMR